MRSTAPRRIDDLLPVEVTEYGVRFATGLPVSFRGLRNTERAPNFGSRFQQDIEPAGRYLIHNPNPGDLPRSWVVVDVHLQRPLVIALFWPSSASEPLYGPNSWKARLHRHYGKTGKALTRALLADGYDGVVTVSLGLEGRERGRPLDTREIVVLRPT